MSGSDIEEQQEMPHSKEVITEEHTQVREECQKRDSNGLDECWSDTLTNKQISIVNELIDMCSSYKINKDTLIKLLGLYKISHMHFNLIVLKRIEDLKKPHTLETKIYLHCSQKINQHAQEADMLESKAYALSQTVNYSSLYRMLNKNELAFKINQYSKLYGMNTSNDSTLEYLDKVIKTYLKNFFDECAGDLAPDNIVAMAKKGKTKFSLL